jgi:hypothetical protein
MSGDIKINPLVHRTVTATVAGRCTLNTYMLEADPREGDGSVSVFSCVTPHGEELFRVEITGHWERCEAAEALSLLLREGCGDSLDGSWLE